MGARTGGRLRRGCRAHRDAMRAQMREVSWWYDKMCSVMGGECTPHEERRGETWGAAPRAHGARAARGAQSRLQCVCKVYNKQYQYQYI